MPKAPTSIANLRHRVVIESVALASDGQGGQEATYSTLGEFWAELKPVSANERNFSEQLEMNRSHKCTMRYNSAVTTSMRLLFDSRYFQIKGIRYPDERKFWMHLDLEENEAT